MLSGLLQPQRPTVLPFHDSYTYYCFDGVYAETKKNNPWIKMTEKYSFIQACNFVNLPRIYDFAKFNSISSLTK